MIMEEAVVDRRFGLVVYVPGFAFHSVRGHKLQLRHISMSTCTSIIVYQLSHI